MKGRNDEITDRGSEKKWKTVGEKWKSDAGYERKRDNHVRGGKKKANKVAVVEDKVEAGRR